MTRETYRGVRLTARALKGRSYGMVRLTVAGAPFGEWVGTEAEHMESMKRTIDAAGERPWAYGEQWHPCDPDTGYTARTTDEYGLPRY